MSENETKHTHVHQDVEGLTKRLSRIEGHVRAVSRMISEEKSCTDVLIQLAAIRSALAQVGHMVLESHVNSCVVEAVRQGESDGAVKDFKQALDIWMKS